MKFTELVFDAHLGAWVYLDIYNDAIYYDNKRLKLRHSLRSGFYPYEYNFLFGRRDGIIQCSYCGIFFPNRLITRDHVYPKSKGGQFTSPACYPCNEAKADTLPIEWAIKSSETSVVANTSAFQAENTSSNLVSRSNSIGGDEDWTLDVGVASAY